MPTPPSFVWDDFFGIAAQLFAGNVVSGKFAESVFMSVVGDFLKTEFASDSLEVGVVGVGNRGRKIHAAAAAESDFGVLRNQAFAQRGQGDRKFDGGARLRAARKSQLLVHHGQHASAGGFDCDDGSIHVAQRVNRGLAYDRIFAGRNVTGGNVFGERTHAEALVIAMAPRGRRNPSDRSGAARVRQVVHAAARVRCLADLFVTVIAAWTVE